MVTWVIEAGLILAGFLKGIVPTINCEDVAVVTPDVELKVGVVLVPEPSG